MKISRNLSSNHENRCQWSVDCCSILRLRRCSFWNRSLAKVWSDSRIDRLITKIDCCLSFLSWNMLRQQLTLPWCVVVMKRQQGMLITDHIYKLEIAVIFQRINQFDFHRWALKLICSSMKNLLNGFLLQLDDFFVELILVLEPIRGLKKLDEFFSQLKKKVGRKVQG